MSQSSKKTGAQTTDASKLDQSSKTQTNPTQPPAPSSIDPAKPNVRPSREQEVGSISPIKPAAKASHPLPSAAQINAYAISHLTDRPLRRGGKLYDGRLPEKYKPAARRFTYAIVALPIALVTSYVVFQRLVLGQERKRLVHPPVDGRSMNVQDIKVCTTAATSGGRSRN
ncbi:MAG: hypothetical protein FRX48_08708 [Lasallia pustulata]|uniref:Uncharacterized protein n=1 Tax=Lasallia pustulata TaxID=136370 RepID=A0A5M8PE06_9LECA|nr:MAG: hypothetical protein FRX48_08708 [Lasallia pustulata]